VPLFDLSLVTAHKVLEELCRTSLLELCGKKYYLTHGIIAPKSALAKKKGTNSHLIGMHLTNLASPFFASLAAAIEIHARSLGYRVLIASSAYHYKEEEDILKKFRSIGVAGVLSCPGTSEHTEDLYINYTLPHVFLGRKPKETKANSVLVNNYPAAKNVAMHFVSKGYEAFAYIGLCELNREQDSRLSGYIDGLRREGKELSQKDILYVKADEIHSSSANIERYLRTMTKQTAIFCFHDLIAVNLLKSCMKLKIKVPETVAIAGFDDLDISSNTMPPLTSVRYNVNEMAETAVGLLIKQIETGEIQNTNYSIEPSLMVRESTSQVKISIPKNVPIEDIMYKVPDR